MRLLKLLIGRLVLFSPLMVLTPLATIAQTDPRPSALADWYFGDGIGTENPPLTSSGVVSYDVVPTGLGARPDKLAAQLTSAYFNAGTNLGVSGNQLTVYLRARMPDGSWNSGLFAKRGSLTNLSYNLFSAPLPGITGPAIGFEINTENSFVQLKFPVSLVATTAWYNLVARFDGTNVQLFCNDRLMDSAPLTGNLLQNTEPTLIGAETDNGSIVRPFTGYIEEAAIWNTSLRDDQLAYLNDLAATNDVYPTRLLHYRDPTNDVGDVHVRYVNGNWALTYLFQISTNWYQAQLITRDFLHFTQCWPTHAPVFGGDVLPAWFAIESLWDPLRNQWRSVWCNSGMRASLSNDRFHWFAATPQLLLQDPGTYLRFSDPAITQVGSNSWQMVITMATNNWYTGGVVGWAASSNLVQWNFMGNLYFPGDRGVPECPTLFNQGNKWYLLASWYTNGVGRPTYQVSDSPSGPWSEFTPNSLDGRDVCAATSDSDGNRRILFGWIPLSAWNGLTSQHWGGHLSFPREIFQITNGVLRSRLPADFDQRIRGPQLFPGLASPSSKSGNWDFQGSQINCYSTEGTNRAILPGLFDRFEGDTTFTLSAGASRVGWLINWQESGAFFEIGVDQTNQLFFIRTAGATVWASLSVPVQLNSQHRLRVIVEQDMIEAIYDEQFTLAARIPTKLLSTSLGLFVDGGVVNFNNVMVNRLCNLQSIPSDRPTLGISKSASNVVLSFSGILQTASELTEPFTDSAGPVSPLAVPALGTGQYWRSRSP